MIKLNTIFDYPNISLHFDLHISLGEKIALLLVKAEREKVHC